MKQDFPDKMRYNWGLHDAQADKGNNRPVRYLPTTFHQDRPLPKWDKAYCDGYKSGNNQ